MDAAGIARTATTQGYGNSAAMGMTGMEMYMPMHQGQCTRYEANESGPYRLTTHWRQPTVSRSSTSSRVILATAKAATIRETITLIL